MTDKERRSVTLDAENHRFLDAEDNASAVVNDLVENYRRTGDRGTAGLQLQLKRKQRELQSAREDVERLEEDVADIERLIREFERDEDSELREAREDLSATPRDPDNPAIQNWAEKLGMTPTELLDELPERTE